jgi:hypothetical protein
MLKLRSVALFVALVAATSVTTTLIGNLGRTVAADTVAEKPGPIYAQLSSANTQLPKDSTPLIVSMESNDSLSGLVHSDKDKAGEITVKTAGVYLIVAAAQVGKEMGESDEYVDIWLKQNGKDVDNSGCRQAIKDPKFTTVLVSQGIAECKAGDVFSVAVSASSPGKGLGIVAMKPKGEPAIPSIIFSMYKIN